MHTAGQHLSLGRLYSQSGVQQTSHVKQIRPSRSRTTGRGGIPHQQQQRLLSSAASTAAFSSSRQQLLVTTEPFNGSQRPPESARLAQLQQQLERQCTSPPPYVPAPDAIGRAKQLTADISRKQQWSQLHNVWLDNSADFSPYHLTAALGRLARLVCRDGVAAADRPELFKFSGALLAAAKQDIPQLDSRGLAQCLWAYAKLQSAAPHSSSSGDAAAAALVSTLLVRGHMQQLHPAQLSQAAWAIATLQAMGMSVPAGWWAAVEQRVLQLMQHLQPCEAACCAWAVTKNGHRLPAALADALQAHIVRCQAVYGPRELLQVMLALAGAQPEQAHVQQQRQLQGAQQQEPMQQQPTSCLRICYTRLQQAAACMSAQEVSTAFLALSRLGARNRPKAQCTSGCHQLPLSLSTRLLKRALDTLPSSSRKDLVTMAYGLAQLELNPGPWFWASFLPFSAAALHVSSPSMLAVLAWSLAKLGVQPGAGWTQELLQHTGFKMQGLNAQEFTMLLYALGKWRACPDPWWWAAFEDATQHMMPYFTAAELAALLFGMGNTGPPALQEQQQQQPPAGVPWRAHHVQHQGQHVQQQGLASLGLHSGMQQQQQQQQQPSEYIPGAAWTAAMLVSAQRALSGAPAGALGGLISGLAKLAVHPSTAWMDAFEAAVLSALPCASLKDVAAVLWGLAVMGVQPSRLMVQATDNRMVSVLHGSGGAMHQHAGNVAAAAHAAGSAGPLTVAAHAARCAPAPAEGKTGVAAHAVTTVDNMALEPLQQWSGLLGGSVGANTPAAPTNGADRPSTAVAAQLLWSVAQLPQPEGVAAWADDLLTAVMPALQYASQETLFVLLRSLAWLQHAPGCRQWVDVWWQAYAAHLQQGTQLSKGTGAASQPLLAALPAGGSREHSCQLGHDQRLQQQGLRLQQLVHAGQHKQQMVQLLQPCPAAERVCQQLTVVLWCFRKLRLQPSKQTAWLQTVVAVTQPLLHQLSVQRFSLLLHQMAQLHVWPGDAWLAHAEAVLMQQRQHMSVKQAQQVFASMQVMGCALKQSKVTVLCDNP